jgi:hypothetical protein
MHCLSLYSAEDFVAQGPFGFEFAGTVTVKAWFAENVVQIFPVSLSGHLDQSDF